MTDPIIQLSNISLLLAVVISGVIQQVKTFADPWLPDKWHNVFPLVALILGVAGSYVVPVPADTHPLIHGLAVGLFSIGGYGALKGKQWQIDESQ